MEHLFASTTNQNNKTNRYQSSVAYITDLVYITFQKIIPKNWIIWIIFITHSVLRQSAQRWLKCTSRNTFFPNEHLGQVYV